MSLPRFYIKNMLTNSENTCIYLSKQEMHHFHVMRISKDEHIAIFNNDGKSFEFIVKEIADDCLYGEVLEQLSIEKLPHLTLVQGISKGERMTQTIRQSTEIGIARIVPFLSQRCIVRLSKAEAIKKGDRFRSIAFSAAKQCGRSILPQIDNPVKMQELLEILPDYDRVVLAWEEKSQTGIDITDALEGCDMNTNIALIIGPEGGFSEDEVKLIAGTCKDKLRIISLGKLILRTETAAVVACALCMHELGALGR